MYSFFLEIKFQIAILSYDISPFLSLILFYFYFFIGLQFKRGLLRVLHLLTWFWRTAQLPSCYILGEYSPNTPIALNFLIDFHALRNFWFLLDIIYFQCEVRTLLRQCHTLFIFTSIDEIRFM